MVATDLVENDDGTSAELTCDAEVAVEAWLRSSVLGWQRLGLKALQAYRLRSFTAGWRVPIQFPDAARLFDILIDADFPWQPARIALVHRLPFPTWTHLEQDGVFCALPAGAEIDVETPVEVVRHLLSAAVCVVEDNIAGPQAEEFRSEFRSYWLTDDKSLSVRSLLTASGPSRTISVWRGQDLTLVADNQDDIVRWLAHATIGKPAQSPRIEHGIFIWLEKALLPVEYPRTAADVLALAGKGAIENALRQMVGAQPDQVVVVIGAMTANGPALAAMTINRPVAPVRGPKDVGTSPMQRGFRHGRMPKDLIERMYLGGSRSVRSAVERIDADWVHGRGQDRRQARLRPARVLLIGCGSVGSGVAMLLARAGVGNLTLVDGELLTSSNVGRHSLGMQSVQRYKSIDLANLIKRDLPHIRSVASFSKRWEVVGRERPEVLSECDLIISTIGSGSSERALNAWHLREGRRVPVVYGWTEPHGCSGQAVAITSGGGCFACGLDRFGASRFEVTEWPDGKARHQEPACGAVYQPYGPVELQHVVALISDLALDCLLGESFPSVRRIWAGRKSLLEAEGGHWSAPWLALAANRDDGGFTLEIPFDVDDACRQCRGTAS